MKHWKVALPMYNVGPILRDAYAQLLQAVIAELRARGWRDEIELVSDIDDLERFWLRPDLLLSQTCGYPLTTTLRGRVRLLGTPTYALPGCSGHAYRSLIVVRVDAQQAQQRRQALTLADFRDCIGVVNQRNSHSGMNALRHTVAPFARAGCFFDKVQLSGSHLASLAMLQSGAADLAAIDCVTYAYASQYFPEKLAGLRVLQMSAAAPGLPLIASLQLGPVQSALLVDVLAMICNDAQIAGPLHMTGLARTTWQDYQAVVTMEQHALAQGYPRIA